MRRHFPWRWAALLLAGLGPVLSSVPLCIAAPAPEYGVKAAFLYKFATYIRWPVSTGTAQARPFVIGVLGDDPFGSTLNEVVRGQTVQGRGIRIRALSRKEEAVECDLVFISVSEQPNLKEILVHLRSAPVLTVSDLDQFAEQGGMIGLLTTEENHIRFDINKAALDRAGLRASSQLLGLARIVDESPGGRR
jgi:YfiR/HmsC-like